MEHEHVLGQLVRDQTPYSVYKHLEHILKYVRLNDIEEVEDYIIDWMADAWDRIDDVTKARLCPDHPGTASGRSM